MNKMLGASAIFRAQWSACRLLLEILEDEERRKVLEELVKDPMIREVLDQEDMSNNEETNTRAVKPNPKEILKFDKDSSNDIYCNEIQTRVIESPGKDNIHHSEENISPKKSNLNPENGAFEEKLSYYLISCESCDFKSSSRKEFNNHFSIVHNKQNKFSCMKCKEVFSTIPTLKAHMKVCHPSKSFTCSKCSFEGSSLTIVKFHHGKQHLGARFHCKKCNYRTHFRPTLTTHLATVHKWEEEALSCSLCSWTGPAYYLKVHSRTAHTGYNCDKCQFKGINDADMKIHKDNKHYDLAARLNLSPELYKKYLDTIRNVTEESDCI